MTTKHTMIKTIEPKEAISIQNFSCDNNINGWFVFNGKEGSVKSIVHFMTVGIVPGSNFTIKTDEGRYDYERSHSKAMHLELVELLKEFNIIK